MSTQTQTKYSIAQFFIKTYTFDLYCFNSKIDRDQYMKGKPNAYPIVASFVNNNVTEMKCDSKCNSCGQYCVKLHPELSKYKAGRVYTVGIEK